MTTVWRIAADTLKYQADDLTGAGAKTTGGRWNSIGQAMVYTSRSTALACLETVVHFGGVPPLNRILVQIDIPDGVMAKATTFALGTLPGGWDVSPPGIASVSLGDQWLVGGPSAILIVPSAIANEDENVLINPLHSDTASIKAIKVRTWLYDARLF